MKTLLFSIAPALLAGTFAMAQNVPPASASTAPASPTEIESMRKRLADWPNLARYHDEDAAMPAPAPNEQRVVFLGDSITDRWGRKAGSFFPGKQYINRGISGQTTSQLLLRFQQDVVHLHPSAVFVLAGTNDIARNWGVSSPAGIEDNFQSMAAIAEQNRIALVIGSILPAAHYRWRPGVDGAAEILQVNRWLKTFCLERHLIFVDFYSIMSDEEGAMKPGLSSDEVHPTAQGYDLMAPLVERALAGALRASKQL